MESQILEGFKTLMFRPDPYPNKFQNRISIQKQNPDKTTIQKPDPDKTTFQKPDPDQITFLKADPDLTKTPGSGSHTILGPTVAWVTSSFLSLSVAPEIGEFRRYIGEK